MKNRLRTFGSFFALTLLLLAGCGDGGQRSETLVSEAPVKVLSDDPVAEILEVLETKDRFERIEDLIAILRAIPADQIDVIPTALDELKLPLREFERLLLVSAWSKVDPEAATKWAMAMERIEILRSSMFAETAYEWARKDPESVRTDFKVGMYSLRGWDATMLRGFVRGWFDSGEPELETFIRDLGRRGDDRQRAVSELIKAKLDVETPEAMIAWATELEGETKYRAYVYSRLAADIAKDNPEIAVAWCEDVCKEKVGADMPHWIASSWVRTEPVKAMDWIVAQPNSVPTRIGLRSSYRRFQISSGEEADLWLEKFSEEKRAGELLQGPVIMYVNRQSNLGREEVALAWSKYIENDWERERALKTLGRRWLMRDEGAAEAWLTDTTELADETKEELRAGLRKYKQKAAETREQLENRPEWVNELM